MTQEIRSTPQRAKPRAIVAKAASGSSSQASPALTKTVAAAPAVGAQSPAARAPSRRAPARAPQPAASVATAATTAREPFKPAPKAIMANAPASTEPAAPMGKPPAPVEAAIDLAEAVVASPAMPDPQPVRKSAEPRAAAPAPSRRAPAAAKPMLASRASSSTASSDLLALRAAELDQRAAELEAEREAIAMAKKEAEEAEIAAQKAAQEEAARAESEASARDLEEDMGAMAAQIAAAEAEIERNAASVKLAAQREELARRLRETTARLDESAKAAAVALSRELSREDIVEPVAAPRQPSSEDLELAVATRSQFVEAAAMAAIHAVRDSDELPDTRRSSVLSRQPAAPRSSLGKLPPATSADLARARLRAEIAPPKPTATKHARPPAPRQPTPSIASRIGARLSKGAYSYMEHFEGEILGPMIWLWRSKAIIAGAMAHVLIPLLMAYMCAQNSAVKAVFFGEPVGSMSPLVANLGGICMLFVICGFLWTLIYMAGRRLISAFKIDFVGLERLGRGVTDKKS